MSDSLKLNMAKLPKYTEVADGWVLTEDSIKVIYKGLYRNIYYKIVGEKSSTSIKWEYHAGLRGSGKVDSYSECVNEIKKAIDQSLVINGC